MLHDADQLEAGSRFRADVCVVGAGPAGLTTALELARRGRSVCLLESGGRVVTRESERLASGESVGHAYFPLEGSRSRAFGGTVHMWPSNDGWFKGRPLSAIDFEVRPGIPDSGWPLGPEVLAPFMDDAHVWCGLGENDYRLERWVTPEGGNLLPADGPVVTRVFKQTRDTPWLGLLDEVGSSDAIDAVLHANVVDLPVAADGRRVTSVLAFSLTGTDIRVDASEIVLAAGALDTARLLLAVRPTSHPTGLGNASDLVGRYFMEHPHIRSGVVRFADPDIIPSLGFHRAHETDEDAPTRVQGLLALDEDVVRDQRLLNHAYYLEPMSEARASTSVRSAAVLRNAATMRFVPPDLGAHISEVARSPHAVATAVRESMARGRDKAPAQVMGLLAMAEQPPTAESRVVLGRRTDSTGLPVACLDWQPDRSIRHSVRVAQDVLDEQLRAKGLGHVEDKLGDETPPRQMVGGWHHMGTTRMDDDPARGVVDTDCRVHGLENLHVAGASVFPTGGSANPTLTVVALALRLADLLDRSHLP